MQKDKFSVSERVEMLPPLGDSNSGVAWERGQWQWLIMVLWNNWAAEYKCDKIKYKVWYRSASCFEFRCAEDYPFSPNVVWISLVPYLFCQEQCMNKLWRRRAIHENIPSGKYGLPQKRGEIWVKSRLLWPWSFSSPLLLQSGTRLIATRAGYSGRISVFWPFIFSLWMPLIIQDCNAGRSNNLCRGRR